MATSTWNLPSSDIAVPFTNNIMIMKGKTHKQRLEDLLHNLEHEVSGYPAVDGYKAYVLLKFSRQFSSEDKWKYYSRLRDIWREHYHNK